MLSGAFSFPAKLEAGIPEEMLVTHKSRVANLLTRF